MIEQRGYIFAAPVVFFMSLREGVIVQVTEAGGSADYRVEVTEGSILSAFVSGDPAAALDAQIQAAEVRVFVGIDVKPGSDPNAINPRSGGVIPVAVLTTAGFKASSLAVPLLGDFPITRLPRCIGYCALGVGSGNPARARSRATRPRACAPSSVESPSSHKPASTAG